MSLTTCLRKAGELLDAEDKAAIMARAAELRKSGTAADEAGRLAIGERLKTVRDELEAGPVVRAQPPAAGSMAAPVLGKTSSALTERGTEIQVRWAVVDAGALVTSHGNDLRVNPDYPQELQPRDRARAASEQQITRIQNDIKPELLGDSPKASDGAPIIGADGVVESGNARTIALRRAYESGKADQYRAWLAANADRFGLKAADIEGIRRPVLVRIGEGGYDRAEFARQANESAVAAMSQTEVARADAARMPDLEGLKTNEDGTLNVAQSSDFIRAFVQQAVSPSDRGAMITAGGELSQQGLQRIRTAVFARAYGDSDLVAMMAESTDANVKNVLNGMMRAAPDVARLADLQSAGARPDADITGPLVAAVRKFSQLRADGMTVDQFMAQRSMFDDDGVKPDVAKILRALQADARAPRRVADMITRMVDSVDAAGDPRQAGMFGDAPSAADTVAAAAERAATPEDAAIVARLAEIQARQPDLMVQLDGMDAPMRAADLMEQMRRESDADTAGAPDVVDAANCLLVGAD